MPLTDQDPPLTVAVAAVVVVLPSVMVTEIVSPLCRCRLPSRCRRWR